MPYDEAMLRYGSDKPDLRFALEISDLAEAVAATEFRVFKGVLEGGGVVRGFNAGPREASRKEADQLTEVVKRYGAGGLIWAVVQEDGSWRSPAAKALSDDDRANIEQRAAGQGRRPAADRRRREPDGRRDVAGRAAAGDRAPLRPDRREGRHELLWVVDFPMFEWNADEQRWDALHHPFTAPTGSFEDPGALRSRAYDIVLNGSEIGGGSIRINRPEVQQQVFTALGISEEEARLALRVPARRAEVRRAAARRARAGHRPDRRDPRQPRLDPRRDRLPEDGLRLGSADRRARGRGRGAARRGGREARGSASGLDPM